MFARGVALYFPIAAKVAELLTPVLSSNWEPTHKRRSEPIVRVGAMCEYREEDEGPWKPLWPNMSR